MLTSRSNHCVSLACAGLLSGLLTCASGHFLEMFGRAAADKFALFIGAIFGFVLIAYWWISQSFRSVWRSAAFILACTAAYFCAFAGGVSFRPFLSFLPSVTGLQLPQEFGICLTGGIIGGAIVFLAAVLFLPNRAQWKHVPLNLLVFCFFSGLLGIAGWALGPYLGTAIWQLLRATHLAEQYQYPQSQPSGGANDYYSLFVIWQAGAAALLGLLLARPRRSLASVALDGESEGLARL